MKYVLKHNYQDFKIFFTFFLIWFSVQFGEVVEDSLAYLLVVSVGILHGANDLLILGKKKNQKLNGLKAIGIYLGIILSCVLIYIAHPYIAILLFIVLSSYHFGEEHLSEQLNQGFWFDLIYFTAYGAFIFSLLFYAALDDVIVVMNELTKSSFTLPQIQVALAVSAILLIALSSYLVITKKKTKMNFGKEAFYLLVLAILFQTSSLVLGFAVYFIFWHSIPSIQHQTKFISGSITQKAIFSYVKNALIFWGISIIGLIGLYFLFPEVNQFASIVFAVLFAVTAPHTWVMHRMKN